ncbi:MAG TPA: beta-L-arabinofuranosidase domain-containing protein [Roseiflexaceae bacterium]|nr:beta-L-arabinofuranosidase domain-containing protein [Roseiflexaceae bacterium]
MPISTAPRQRYTPARITDVTLDDPFWTPRTRVNRERTIPHIYRQLAETGRIDAFRPDWDPPPEVRARHAWGGTPVMFWDSDVAKWVEAASYSLATHPDPALDALLDEVVALIAARQQPDGYLNTWFTTVDPQGRWTNLRDWHELYDAGHLIEAAVAHYEATGKRTLLDPMRRYADYIGSVFGTEEGKRRGYCGHPEIELALVRLARATGEERYLALSRYFVNERGRRPHYYDQEARERGEPPERYHHRTYEYNQAHAPVREQQQVVGHAVRAMYLYCAMADLAMADGDVALREACERLWRHLASTRTYVMGGIGTSRHNEGFTSDYDLPNESAYAETCAAIGLVFWAQRMLQLELDRRYADVLELALYNAVLSGVSLDGERFFYDNPLASDGHHHRQPWFVCPCCPPNLARILASLGQYLYAQGEDELVVHLYAGSRAELTAGGGRVTLRQETRYPWDGAVLLRVDPEAPAHFALRLRLPGWCVAPRAAINGEPVDGAAAEGGYLRLERLWHPGDQVTLALPMPVERVYAHPAVRADVGRVALRRGPLVYCLEQADHAAPLERIVLPANAELVAREAPGLLGGVVVVEGAAAALDDTGWEGELYRTRPPAARPAPLRAIPYFAWDNRQPGAMLVWLPETRG